MESEAEKSLMKRKKERIERAVKLACNSCQVSVPKINFKGCPYEWKNDGGIQLAHYHSGMICVSERQLKLEHLGSGLEETAVHEVIHHLGFNHNTSAKRRDFERRKNQVLNALWKELQAPLPQPKAEKMVHNVKKKSSVGQKREELESEVRILIHQLDDARGEARIRILDEIEAAKRELHKTSYIEDGERPIIKEVDIAKPENTHSRSAAMTKSQVEESRKKLCIEEPKPAIKPIPNATVKTESEQPTIRVSTRKSVGILSKIKSGLGDVFRGFKTQIITSHCHYCGDTFDAIVRPKKCPSCGYTYCSNPCINIHRC